MPESHSPAPLDPELSALAGCLRGLAPATPQLDRDALMFQAGRRAAPRGWLWPTATGVCASAAVVLAVLLATRPPEVRTIERVVTVEVERPTPAPPESAPPTEPVAREWLAPATPAPASLYRKFQDHLLRWGLDGLGDPPPVSPSPRHTVDSLLESF